MNEQWRAVVNFEGGYEVSSEGRVRSIDRVVILKNGQSRRYKGQFLKLGLASSGYFSVVLGRAAGSYNVHVLVAAAFIGPCPRGQEVRHRNGNRADSTALNLEYGTRSQNITDAVRHGTWMSPARAAHCATLWKYRWL